MAQYDFLPRITGENNRLQFGFWGLAAAFRHAYRGTIGTGTSENFTPSVNGTIVIAAEGLCAANGVCVHQEQQAGIAELCAESFSARRPVKPRENA
jgi:hypothetical protein